MKKSSIKEIISYWDYRIRISKGSIEGVLWHDMPIWNKYTDDLHKYHLRKWINKIKPGDKVLDLGCGVGRFTFRLANLCKEIYGVDSSCEGIKYCVDKSKELKINNALFRVMDARRLDFDNNFFDFIFSIGCLSCIPDINEFLKALREIYRVLKKGGIGVILEHTHTNREKRLLGLKRRDWIKLVKDSGAEIIDLRGLDIVFLRYIIFLVFKLVKIITRYPLIKLGKSKDELMTLDYLLKHKRVRFIENVVLNYLINFIKLFEYIVPQITSFFSDYSIIVITKLKEE